MLEMTAKEGEQLDPSGAGLKVALYLRMSDKEQRLSIEQQRKECVAYALSRGWTITIEYVDSGKSGSKNVAARKEWHRMLRDAQAKDREWDAILVWDTSRFGRLDSQQISEFTNPLRKAGVWLETAKGERLDWSTSMGRIFAAISAERDNEYSLGISRNVIRGRRSVVDMGYWATIVPYGYDRQYVENGSVKLTVPRREPFSKPRNWRLIPIPNEAEANVVRWLFKHWAEKDATLTGTVKLLLKRGISSPSGVAYWTIAQLKRVLTERAYCGDSVIGNGEATKEVHGRIGARVKENTHEPLVDRETWQTVQDRVKAREGAEWRPKTSSGPLSGVCRCGHCGYVMARRTDRGKTYYVCESSLRRPSLGCSQWRITESEIFPLVMRELIDAIDLHILDKLGGETRPPKESANEIDRLTREVERLRRTAERAAANFLTVDAENMELAQTALNKIRKEYESASNALALAKSSGAESRSDIAKVLNATKSTLAACVVDGLDNSKNPQIVKMRANGFEQINVRFGAEAASVRSLLQKLGVEIRFFWKRRGSTKWALTTGVLRAQFASDGRELLQRASEVSCKDN